MSYCRFSSHDFQCDVYVYQSAEGWTTHVAGNRLVGDTPIPHIDFEQGFATEAFGEQVTAQMTWIKTARRVPIGLPMDGAMFIDATPGACAEKLENLQALGYRVPQIVIDDLRCEAAENKAQS